MNKRIRNLGITSVIVGIVMGVANNIYSHNYPVSDFMRGFWDGFSVTLALIGMVVIVFFVVKRLKKEG